MGSLLTANLVQAQVSSVMSQKETPPEPYTQPLWFDVINQGVRVSSPNITYDMKATNGESLQWGPLLLTENFFSVHLTSRQKLDAEGSKMAFFNQEDMVLFFAWPEEVIPAGVLEITDRSGKSVWKKIISPEDLHAWREKIKQVQEQLVKQGKTPQETERNPLLKKTYAFFRSKSDPGPDLKLDQGYKFCLKNQVEESYVQICTPFYTLKGVGTQIEIHIDPKTRGPAIIKFQNKEQASRGKISVEIDQPVHFFAQLRSGALVEFKTLPPALKIYDMAIKDEKNPQTATLIAARPAPVFMTSENLSSPDPFDITNELWRGTYTLSDKHVFLPAKGGGYFQYDLMVENLPLEKHRRYLDRRRRATTYSASDSVTYRQTNRVTPEKLTLRSPQPGAWNRSYFLPRAGTMEPRSYLDIYRGYPGEVSLRLTGLASAQQTSVLSEIHLGYWFNSIAGWDQYYLSRQRWGLSAKSVSLLSAIPATTDQGTTRDIQIKSSSVDLKYRFTPGLWERDETWGALLSYEALSYANHRLPKLGYGFFWARPMPAAFDRVFNYVPFFRSPKWVELELIKYGTSLDSKYRLGDDFVVNFHGKVLWTPRFFGEAGFGVKKYYFLEKNLNQGASLEVVYGTIGLGLNF